MVTHSSMLLHIVSLWNRWQFSAYAIAINHLTTVVLHFRKNHHCMANLVKQIKDCVVLKNMCLWHKMVALKITPSPAVDVKLNYLFPISTNSLHLIKIHAFRNIISFMVLTLCCLFNLLCPLWEKFCATSTRYIICNSLKLVFGFIAHFACLPKHKQRTKQVIH